MGDVTSFRDIKLELDSGTGVKFYIDGDLKYTTSSNLNNGYLRFPKGCVNSEVKEIYVSDSNNAGPVACDVSENVATGKSCDCEGNTCSAVQFCYEKQCHDTMKACAVSENVVTGKKCDCTGNSCSDTQFCYENQCHNTMKACAVSENVVTGKRCDCSGNSCSDAQFCYESQCHDTMKACAVSENVVTGKLCDCSGNSCSSTKYCYENQCHDTMKACTISNANPAGTICDCSGNECTATQHCYDDKCHDDAAGECAVDYLHAITEKCHQPGKLNVYCDVNQFFYAGDCQAQVCDGHALKSLFYGSKVHGKWDSKGRQMNMYIKTPHEISITEIKWINATSDALKYSGSANGKWTIDTETEPCKKRYYLNVKEKEFFGSGSLFSLTGSQLRSTLKVTALREVKETHEGKHYSYNRTMSNYVPVVVNLETETNIQVSFKITSPTPEVFFLFFKGAHDNLEDRQKKNIEIEMEIHSSNCINSSRTDSTYTSGTRIQSGTSYLVSGTTPTYKWTTRETLENNLCVQELTWSFVPKPDQLDTAYEMTLEFIDRGGVTHDATAEIFIETADVLGAVGFDGNMTLYEEKELLTESDKFYLGQQFFAKISLSNLIVDAKTITCKAFNITQTNPVTGAVEKTDLKGDDMYNFREFNLTGSKNKNKHICSAELESPHFHKTADGYTSVLIADVEITYEDGSKVRRILKKTDNAIDRLRKQKYLEGRFKEEEIFDVMENEEEVGDDLLDDYYSNKEHAPEEKDMSVEMFIGDLNPFKAMNLSPQNGAASTFYEKYTTTIIISGITLFGGVLFAGWLHRRKNSMFNTNLLIDDEEEI
jgi:hypothetical protein